MIISIFYWSFFVLALLSAFGLVVGLINPAKLNDPKKPQKNMTRGEVVKTFGVMFFISCVVCVATHEPIPEGKELVEYYEDEKDSPIKDIALKSSDSARKIGIGYAQSINVPEQFQEDFYLCMGDFVRTKSPELKLGEIMGWCKIKYDNDAQSFQKEAKVYDYYLLKEQFSRWDGSHIQTVAAIKKIMNDPDSFDHDDTRYHLVLKDDNPHMVVLTSFRGANAFGGKVLQRIQTVVDLHSGNVLEMDSLD